MIYILITAVSFLFAFLSYRYVKVLEKNKEILKNYSQELENELKKQTADLIKQKNFLEDSEFRWKFAVEGNGDGLWDWNVETREVYFSSQWKNMLGFEENEIKNSLEEWERRVHPKDLRQVYQDLTDHIEGKTSSYQNEHRVLCKNGSYKWILDRGIVVEKDVEGKAIRLIGTHTDIDEKKKSETELKKANIKFNSIFNYSLDAIVLLDTQSGNFSDVNPRAIDLYGYTKEEFLDLKIKDIEASQDEKKIELTQKRIIEQGWDQFTSIHKLKNGTIIDVHINAVSINILDKNYLYATFKDITKEKQLEQKIISEKDFVSTIIDNANSVIAVIDADGRMFRVNKYAQDFTGYSQEEIASEPYFWSRFLAKEQKDNVIDIIKDAKQGNIVKSFKNSWFSKDGEERIFEWSNTLVKKSDGTINYIATIGIDITHKEHIQKLILDKKDEFEAIFKYAQDGISIMNFKGDILKFNDSFKDLLEYSEKELLGKNCSDFIAPEDKEKNMNAIQQAIDTGHVGHFEKDCITKNNKRITVLVSISLLPDKKTLLSIVKDASSVKLLEEQSKMASMGEMIGNIAHQWRQPLSVISTSATGMKLQKEYGILTDELFYTSCTNINDNAQYLSKTIDDFRNFIKGERKKEEFDLSDDISSFLRLVEGTIKNHDINLILEVESKIHINGYPSELIQCFINIFNNAKDAFVENNIEDKYIFISTMKKDQNIIIKIKDNAGGIPDNILEKVFEPYFTTKHKSLGTGLGLHMTYNLIVDGMQGTINADNVTYRYDGTEYTGAEFVIRLPLN